MMPPCVRAASRSQSPCTAPPLTTVAQPNEEKGRLAARWLMDDIERGADPAGRREQILPTELVVRESTAAPPGR